MGDEKLVTIFKALANPHRLEIFKQGLQHIPLDGEIVKEQSVAACCQRELADDLGIAPSTLSHHFKELKNAGLFRMERNGQMVTWALNKSGIQRLKDFLKLLEQDQ